MDIKEYNSKYRDGLLRPEDGHKFMPYLVVAIDEYAGLIMPGSMSGNSKYTAKSITKSILRIAQKGRAAGIHVIIATQCPSVDVITGLIKANFPTRIAFKVVTKIDSVTIPDFPGAEYIIGKDEKKTSTPVTEFDPLFEEVAEYVVKRAEASVSDLQRKFYLSFIWTHLPSVQSHLESQTDMSLCAALPEISKEGIHSP